MINFIYQYEAVILLSVFLGGFSLFALLEWARPKRELTQVKFNRWFNNIALMVCGTIVVRIVLPAAATGIAYLVEQEQWGVANSIELPSGLEVVIIVILLDLIIYFQHAMFHVLPILWRFHRVHHSDLDCDITTGARFHPVETVITFLIKLLAIILLGAPVLAVILFEIVFNLMSMFTHSNIRLNSIFEQVLRWFIVTPDMHRVHHSVQENETNSNFAFHLSLWDRLFGTYKAEPEAGQLGMTIGLDQFREPDWQRFAGLIYMPFAAAVSGYAINHRDTKNADELASTKSLIDGYKERLTMILEHTDDAFLTVDKDWIITYINTNFESLLHVKQEDVIGQDLREVLPDVVSMLYKMMRATFTTQTTQVSTILYGPTMRYFEVHATPSTEGIVVNLRDITARKKAEENFINAKEKEFRDEEKIKLAVELASYMDAINEHALVSVTDVDGIIIEANDKFCEITGYSKDELIGQDHNIVNSGVHPDIFFTRLWATIKSGQKWHGEVCNRAKDGSLYWVDSAIVPIKDTNAAIERYVSVRIDITEHKRQAEEINDAYQHLAELNEQLEQISRIDGLTSIANRRYFDEVLSTEISKLSRTSTPLTLILCDIDYFKNYNDSYGHPAGDACLQQVAQAIDSSFFRTGDLVARYGGEEFAVVLPNVNKEAGLMLAERIRENVARLKLEHDSSAIGKIVTISVGVTSLVPDRYTLATMLIEKADKALYLAKEEGRNNVQYFQ